MDIQSNENTLLDFEHHGIHHGSLLGIDEVHTLRQKILEYYFDTYRNIFVGGRQSLNPSECLHSINVLNIILKQPLLKCLGDILGADWILIPDFNIHINSLYLNGWHIDAGS